MSWIIATLVAICARAFLSIFTKKLSVFDELSAATKSALFMFVCFGISLPFVGVLGGFHLDQIASNLFLCSLLVLGQFVGNTLYISGLAKTDTSLAQIILSSTLIWGSLFSIIFLDSRFRLHQFFGMLVLLVAIAITQYNKKSKLKITKSVYMLLGAAVFFSIFQVAGAKSSGKISSGTYLLVSYGGTGLTYLLIYGRKIINESILCSRKKAVATALIPGCLSSVITFTAAYVAFKKAPDAGVVIALLPSQVILSVILGIWLLKERTKLKSKLLAGLLAALSGYLIKS
jgi:drug/metabolite transporter (DMT)-like permease